MRKMWVVMGLIAAVNLHAASGRRAWLRYEPLQGAVAREDRRALPRVVVTLGHSAVLDNARGELIRGVYDMLGVSLQEASSVPKTTDAFVLSPHPELKGPSGAPLPTDTYLLRAVSNHGHRDFEIESNSDAGVLYGVFGLLRRIALGESLARLDIRSSPYAPIRWVNEWDNLDGSIERGYGGRSIFWSDGHVRHSLTRVSEYGRLLASIGVNGCVLNNVNADPRFLTDALIPQIARIADVLRPWGVRVGIAVDLSSPRTVGGLSNFDPLDPNVEAWWKERADALYRAIPDFGGFVMKAGSEGQAGPGRYGRTPVDAANTVARALAPHGGILFYRAFVYNNHLDWRDLKADRARAAYDIFHPLDGKFDANVIVQIKNGPIDFQVREPASPLFGGLEKTNQAIELQITQEYLGQSRHMVFLAPLWKATLDFDMHTPHAGTPVKAIVAGKVFHRPTGGFVGVSDVGMDADWTGNQLSQANLYAFGRLAWNANLSSREIAENWTKLTFGDSPKIVSTITMMLLSSWRTYEDYTGPLGLQTLVAVTGNHYEPDVQSSEHNGWGQWHRAGKNGVGMDRTVATGTGYIGQYSPAVARIYESLATCPDNLILFMHHVPYTYKLHNGKTVIQTIYDLHYVGAERVEQYVRDWEALRGLIDPERYQQVLNQLKYQAGAAELWRDAVCQWFRRESGIPDAKGRVGHYPNRFVAESMELQGYVATKVHPWEDASNGEAVECPITECSASFHWNGAAGIYKVRVRYFDQSNGVSHFELWAGEKLVGQWAADAHLPTWSIDGTSSTRITIRNVALHPGEEIRIEGKPNDGERAALDYIEIRRQLDRVPRVEPPIPSDP